MSDLPFQTTSIATRFGLRRALITHGASYVLASEMSLFGLRITHFASLAILLALISWGIANVLGYRWALSTARTRIVEQVDWIRWAIARLLERATADDRRGRASSERVAEMIARDVKRSGFEQEWTRRVGADAVSSVAEVLTSAPIDDATVGTRVFRRIAEISRTRERIDAARWIGFAVCATALAIVSLVLGS